MQLEVGAIYTGKVTGITKFGAFIELEPGVVGMVHISEVANTYVEKVSDFLTIGQEVKVKLLTIGDENKLSLSVKKALPPPENPQHERPARQGKAPAAPAAPLDPFEEMMARFKQSSDEKMSDLRKSAEGRRSGGYPSRKH